MQNNKMKLLLIGAAIFFFVCVSQAGAATEQPVKVAVLPFTMHTPSDLAYLQDGIRDMLVSRLAWQGKVQIVDRNQTDQAVRGLKSSVSVNEATRIGETLKADYVLFGSMTAVGKSISIDSKMVPTSGSNEPVSLHVQAQSLDEVIPKVNQFAEDINRSVFGRPAQASVESSDAQSASTMNPELLLPPNMFGGDKISYLNPNFIEVTPEGALRQPGLWRSQTFKEGMVGMDIGDLDGDGSQEIVTVSYDKITVFTRQGSGLKTLATYDAGNMNKFIWVSLADLNRDGRDEIYVTNLIRRNLPRGNTDNRISYGRDEKREVASMSLALVNGNLTVTSDNIPFYLNAVTLPGRGKVLLGQRKGTDKAFASEIYEMQLRGNEVQTLSTVPLPSRCNIYNFAKADINNDGADEYVVIGNENRLLILSASGEQLWKSTERYAATSNFVEGKIEDLSFNQIDYYYIPSPILITDLNHDGILEIVVNDNLGQGAFLPNNFKIYDKGRITSLSWNQLGLIENWKTQDIGGMVTALRVGDLRNDGKMELIASLVLAKDFMRLWESRSTIFSYDLNVEQSKTAKLQ